MEVLFVILKKATTKDCLGLELIPFFFFFWSSPPNPLLASYNRDAMAGTPAALLDYEENLQLKISVRVNKRET